MTTTMLATTLTPQPTRGFTDYILTNFVFATIASLLGLPVRRDRKVRQARLDPLAQPEQRELPDHRASKGILEQLVQKATQGRLARRASKVRKVLQDQLATLRVQIPTGCALFGWRRPIILRLRFFTIATMRDIMLIPLPTQYFLGYIPMI